jgi:hypothetical protein
LADNPISQRPIVLNEQALAAAHRAIRDLLRKRIAELVFDFSDFDRSSVVFLSSLIGHFPSLPSRILMTNCKQ